MKNKLNHLSKTDNFNFEKIEANFNDLEKLKNSCIEIIRGLSNANSLYFYPSGYFVGYNSLEFPDYIDFFKIDGFVKNPETGKIDGIKVSWQNESYSYDEVCMDTSYLTIPLSYFDMTLPQILKDVELKQKEFLQKKLLERK